MTAKDPARGQQRQRCSERGAIEPCSTRDLETPPAEGVSPADQVPATLKRAGTIFGGQRLAVRGRGPSSGEGRWPRGFPGPLSSSSGMTNQIRADDVGKQGACAQAPCGVVSILSGEEKVRAHCGTSVSFPGTAQVQAASYKLSRRRNGRADA
jgi:hypothetical protein